MELYNADCLDVLEFLPDNRIDALITDPPAGISFMGKDWDHDRGGRDKWIEWFSEIMKEVYRVLKPGAHGLVWAIPRTSHWTATALEDAGFEIRDVITHLFGSGFPKSLDISKAIDKSLGSERKIVGKSPNWRPAKTKGGAGFDKAVGVGSVEINLTVPATNEAKQWQGWGTALKPASEHWILIRKPISEKTIAANVLKLSTGGINIDMGRIPVGPEGITKGGCTKVGGMFGSGNDVINKDGHLLGRFPANLVLSHNSNCEENQCSIGCAAARLDAQSGPCKTGGRKIKTDCGNALFKRDVDTILPIDVGSGASRFFYCSKASDNDKFGICDTCKSEPKSKKELKLCLKEEHEIQFHPTVKSTKLMQYLIKLITPPNGLVLDPFMGSGSTGKAAKQESFKFIGIEKDKHYFEIAKERLK